MIESGTQDGQAVGELLKRLGDQSRRLAGQEAALVRAELGAKARDVGLGAGLLGLAGVLGLLALLTLTATLVLALATAVTAWLAAAIVTAVYLVGAAVVALLGRSRLEHAAPLAPTRALASVKEDISWLKSRVRSART